MDLEELERLHQVLLDINDRAINDEEFNNLLSDVFNENIEDKISRLHNILEESDYS